MKTTTLKVAIVGCGKIADDHASQIARIANCEIVGVCDREQLMAKQLQERFGVKRYFSDLDEMLSEVGPDVVHITTSPESHFSLATTCLKAGCHVYVEKPFTIHADEARQIITLAEEMGLKVTAGHDDQFRHVARRMRVLVQSGYLGGAPIHMESHYCYELGEGYATAVLGNKQHWVRRLPGGLLHNIISHGIARIAEFFTSDSPQVISYGFTSSFLKDRGEKQIIDELRVILSDEDRATAYFTFSSQMRPALHQFRAYGPKNGLILDQDQETLVRLHGSRLPSYAEKFVTPVNMAGQFVGNVSSNLRKFMGNDFHMKAGMKFLIERFYESIARGTPVPIPYREIILTATIMDTIFDQLNRQQQLYSTVDTV